MIWRIACTASV